MHRKPPIPRLFLCLLTLIWGGACSDAELATALDAVFSPQETGQSLLFAGTDPISLSTNIYRVRALGQDTGQWPDFATAQDFALESITAFDPGLPEGLLRNSSDVLFTDAQPYPLPDRQGERFLITAEIQTGEDEAPRSRLGLYSMIGEVPLVTPELLGLQSASFNWTGSTLLLAMSGPEGQSSLASLPVEGPWPDEGTELPTISLETPYTNPTLLGLVPESEEVLVRVEAGEGLETVLLLGPRTGEHNPLLEPTEASLISASFSPDGSWLAIVLLGYGSERRQILLVEIATAQITNLGDSLDDDCYWPNWAPIIDPSAGARLAFVCQNLSTNRPDLVQWSSQDPENKSDAHRWDVLTASAQPGIFAGTMDGVVIRSTPTWTPDGALLVFGASTAEASFEGAGMTLFALPEQGEAYSLYSGSDTSVGWAHFSTESSQPTLLIWERNETGLELEADKHPIRVLDPSLTDENVRNVELGEPLRVAYPVFAGGNTLFYP